MNITKKAQAGTMQSSDLMVFLEPADELRIEIDSTVKIQFGHLIESQIDAVLEKLSVTSGYIKVSDRGALDYAIAARLETAIRRASEEELSA